MNEIKKARIEAGISQQEMSELLEIPLGSVANWEQGRTKCPEYLENLIIKKLKNISKKDKVIEINILDHDPNKKYPEGTLFVLDDRIDMEKFNIPDFPEDDEEENDYPEGTRFVLDDRIDEKMFNPPDFLEDDEEKKE